MPISREEIKNRWLAGGVTGAGIDALVGSFNVAERVLGRAWLEEPLADGIAGPVIALPIHLVGENLRVLERAHRSEQLIARVRKREGAAMAELHALALCADDPKIDPEVAPTVDVDGHRRVPDFRVRQAGEPWVYVEVTAPTHSESKSAAHAAATRLSVSRDLIPDGVSVQVRFRDEPDNTDIEEVMKEIREAAVIGRVTARERFVIHAEEFVRAGKSTPEFLPIGGDEQGRPLSCSLRAEVRGEGAMIVGGAGLAVRVPYTDERGRKIIDAEAKQLPKAGPGLICIFTQHGAYWRGLIERSFSPDMRRRISGVLLVASAIRPGDCGVRLATAGRLILNPHARVPLPQWLSERLGALPRSLM